MIFTGGGMGIFGIFHSWVESVKISLRKIFVHINCLGVWSTCFLVVLRVHDDSQLLSMLPMSVSRVHNLRKVGRNLHNKLSSEKQAEIARQVRHWVWGCFHCCRHSTHLWYTYRNMLTGFTYNHALLNNLLGVFGEYNVDCNKLNFAG